MKKIIMLIMVFSTSAYAQENECEKNWESGKKAYKNLKIYSETVDCRNVWEDPKKESLLKNMGLNSKNPQWMSTGECQVVELNKSKYKIYQASFQNDHSDIRIISDDKGNSFAFFRDLGRFDMTQDKFYPRKNSNIHGVYLKCNGIGSYQLLKPILSSYINNKKIDLKKFSFEDLNK